MVSPKAPGGLASPSSTTPKSSVNGTAGGVPPSSPRAASSPLNRLQSMQPFDYRKAGEAKTPDSISSRGSIERCGNSGFCDLKIRCKKVDLILKSHCKDLHPKYISTTTLEMYASSAKEYKR